MLAMRIVLGYLRVPFLRIGIIIRPALFTEFVSRFLPMQSSLTSFWRSFTGLVQLIFSFPSWFYTIWFYCCHTFHSFLTQITFCFSFGSKDMITAFTYLPSYSSVSKPKNKILPYTKDRITGLKSSLRVTQNVHMPGLLHFTSRYGFPKLNAVVLID